MSTYPQSINLLLSNLPYAQYSSMMFSDQYVVTKEAALRILKVTQPKDHEYILSQCISWNEETKAEQRIQEGRGDDHCEISAGVIGGTFYISVNRMSDTESVYLTLEHDRDLVKMDIQLP